MLIKCTHYINMILICFSKNVYLDIFFLTEIIIKRSLIIGDDMQYMWTIWTRVLAAYVMLYVIYL